MSEEVGPQRESDSRGAAIYAAAILLAGLAVAVAIVIVSGSDSSEAGAADSACIEAWNSDKTAVAFGQHQFGGHGYERVQVLRVDARGGPSDAEGALCAVVFAAGELDPEPGARAQVLLDGSWTGFESLGGVDDRAIGQLQSDAVAGTNARLTAEGELVEFEA